MRVFHFVIKKKKRALRPDSFFFNDSDIFKNILIPIITSQAILYSQNVFRGFFFSLLLSRVTRPRARFVLASV